MNFATSVRTVLSKYAVFSGRARRSEYWWFSLFSFLVYLVVDFVDLAVKSPILSYVVALALLLPSLGVLARRLHDTGRTAWWILIGLVPIAGAIVLIVFACLDSTPGDNKYGPSPKMGGGYQPAY